MHFLHPVAQAIEDKLLRYRVIAIKGVATAGVVVVELFGIGYQIIINAVIDALEREHRPLMIALVGMVEDHI